MSTTVKLGTTETVEDSQVNKSIGRFTNPFSFATKTEIFSNLVGLLAAIVAGATQPLMNIPFGQVSKLKHRIKVYCGKN